MVPLCLTKVIPAHLLEVYEAIVGTLTVTVESHVLLLDIFFLSFFFNFVKESPSWA